MNGACYVFRSVVNAAGAFFLFFLLVALNGCVTSPPTPENRARAAYLFHFTEFVEWPASSFSGPHAPLVIGLLGKNPFGTEMDRLARGHTVNGHPVVVKRLTPLSDLKTCHMVYIDQSVQWRLPLIFYSAAGGATLTVSDAPNFVEKGGMIGFFKENDRWRFDINHQAVNNAGLKMNSQLLIMAKHPQGAH